jgi:urease accessory protein
MCANDAEIGGRKTVHDRSKIAGALIATASPRLAANALSSVRSRGIFRVGFARGADRTTVSDFYQSGCLRVRLPRSTAGADPCAVMLNSSGGLADGDRLSQNVTWGEGARASVTGAAAEKVYRAMADGARIETRLAVGAAADAEWLPQETILFDRARLTRDTRVTIAGDGAFLGVEAVLLGRMAMGEAMVEGALHDSWRIWREGRLVYADALRLDGPVERRMARAAIGSGARAMAVLIHVSRRAASLLGNVREALAGALGTAAASAWNGMLVVRLLARDGALLRHDMLRALAALRGGLPLPRVWSC